MKLSELNNAPIETFVETLSMIFEHSPWFAVKAVNSRPFETVEKLHQAMCDAVEVAPEEHRLALIKAHPD
jgi:2-oxo-4-hydroxy-4-carboxy--5-ureidoimidazoline (OHCU) decarboxylase